MTTFLITVMVFSACFLDAHKVASSESELCIQSINVNSWKIVYSDINNTVQDIHPVDEISAETAMVLLTITAPSTDNGNESRLYQVSKIYLCYYVPPELLDLMAFHALKLVKRTQQTSLDVRTFTICGNESWENLLYDAFALDKNDGFVRRLQINNQTYYSSILNSGMLLFMSLGLISFVVVFHVVLPFLDTITASLKYHRPAGSSRRVINSLNIGFCALYFGYTMFGTTSYYYHFDGALDQYITSFTGNAVFLLSAVFSSFLGSLLCSRHRHRDRPFTRISHASSVALTTAVLYHSVFLLLVLVEDFSTSSSSTAILITIIMCTYTLFPAALRHYETASSTRQILRLCFSLALSGAVPFLYTTTIIGAFYPFNAGNVYIATKSWLAAVLFLTALAWFSCLFIFVSAFKQRRASPEGPRITV